MDDREIRGRGAAPDRARDEMRGGGREREPAQRPDFADPESWHDLAERGTPRNG
jgi:hypothetical protein